MRADVAAGTDKYGHPPRFDVIAELEAMGWIDLLHHRGAPARWVTASRDRGGVRIDHRTDYVFGTPGWRGSWCRSGSSTRPAPRTTMRWRRNSTRTAV